MVGGAALDATTDQMPETASQHRPDLPREAKILFEGGNLVIDVVSVGSWELTVHVAFLGRALKRLVEVEEDMPIVAPEAQIEPELHREVRRQGDADADTARIGELR